MLCVCLGLCGEDTGARGRELDEEVEDDGKVVVEEGTGGRVSLRATRLIHKSAYSVSFVLTGDERGRGRSSLCVETRPLGSDATS